LGIEYVPPEPLSPLDFSVPEGVDPVWVNKNSGQPSSQGAEGAILEYFVTGTEPAQNNPEEPNTSSYLESPEL
jgi:hypothetical protein